MESYIPFLLPLLDLPEPPATSPMEEEACLRQWAGDVSTHWDTLQAAVPATYGLPLLISSDGQPSRIEQAGQRTPGRSLLLREGERTWFLLEHPTGLADFDRLGKPGQAAALARPFLFNRLWRSSGSGQRKAHPTVQEDGPLVSEDGREALAACLSRLFGTGRPSDWHLEPGRRAYRSRLRLDGRLTPPVELTLSRGEWLLNTLLAQAGLERNRDAYPLEDRLSLTLEDGASVSLRLSLIPALLGPALAARLLYEEPGPGESLASLGLGETRLARLLDSYRHTEGLWLVVGPTGSGKSTTLHALVHESIRRQEKVLAVEDPVERILPGAQQVSLGQPPGLSYPMVMRAFLRQAPDTVLLGEIRDPETASVALQAARTGHRVLSTLHARSNAGLGRRLQDLGQDPATLAAVCRIALHQRLLPRLCPDCKGSRPLSALLAGIFAALQLPAPDTVHVACGCPACLNGYRGRRPIFSDGRFPSPEETVTELGRFAWSAVSSGEVDPQDALALLPPELRARFELCQGSPLW